MPEETSEAGESSLTAEQAFDALESFVIDNDDLLALEERIGRFNIFDSLGIARAEIRHSNFLAWLLDPAESHGCGELFLSAVLMDLLRNTPRDKRPLSPVDLDGEQLQGVEVRREWRNIDLLIRCESPRFVIAIENKVDSGEHSNQLQRYGNIVNNAFPDTGRMFVFLTPEGDEASGEDWTPYSYRQLHAVLTRVRKTNAGSIGEDVLTFLDHYLRLLGSRMMDDPKIDELCKRIYKNHRQAIELIQSRVGSLEARITAALTEAVRRQGDRFRIVNTSLRRVAFVPTAVYEQLPPASGYTTLDPKCWLVWKLYVEEGKVRLFAQLWKCRPECASLRPALLAGLMGPDFSPNDALGFKLSTRAERRIDQLLESGSIRLSTHKVMTWPRGDEPDFETLETKTDAALEALHAKSAAIAEAVALAMKNARV